MGVEKPRSHLQMLVWQCFVIPAGMTAERRHSDPLPGEYSRGSARAGSRGGAGDGAGRLDRRPAGVPAVCGADRSPRLALQAGGESGPGFGLVAGVVGGSMAPAGLIDRRGEGIVSFVYFGYMSAHDAV